MIAYFMASCHGDLDDSPVDFGVCYLETVLRKSLTINIRNIDMFQS